MGGDQEFHFGQVKFETSDGYPSGDIKQADRIWSLFERSGLKIEI